MRSTFPNVLRLNPSLKNSVLQNRASSLKALLHRSQNLPRHRNHLHSHLSRAGEHSTRYVKYQVIFAGAFGITPASFLVCTRRTSAESGRSLSSVDSTAWTIAAC